MRAQRCIKRIIWAVQGFPLHRAHSRKEQHMLDNTDSTGYPPYCSYVHSCKPLSTQSTLTCLGPHTHTHTYTHTHTHGRALTSCKTVSTQSTLTCLCPHTHTHTYTHTHTHTHTP